MVEANRGESDLRCGLKCPKSSLQGVTSVNYSLETPISVNDYDVVVHLEVGNDLMSQEFIRSPLATLRKRPHKIWSHLKTMRFGPVRCEFKSCALTRIEDPYQGHGLAVLHYGYLVDPMIPHYAQSLRQGTAAGHVLRRRPSSPAIGGSSCSPNHFVVRNLGASGVGPCTSHTSTPYGGHEGYVGEVAYPLGEDAEG